MPATQARQLSRAEICHINSLGGPPLPMDAPPSQLKVILENQAASEIPAYGTRIAEQLRKRFG